MPSEITNLPIAESWTVKSESEVVDAIKAANENSTAIYPIGGGTSLDYGLPAKVDGNALELVGLNGVIDYPARDMTITVGAGITMAELHATLQEQSQQLPIDAPLPVKATLGGVIACNQSGPRRYGHGTMRDHVIGIRAIDGRGEAFAAGGRVVKNVAGYDFCKLLTGSLGTLGVITEVTLKLKPLPVAGSFVLCELNDLARAEGLLARIVDSRTTPILVELLDGDTWSELTGLHGLQLAVGFEGSEVAVDWMTKRLQAEWKEQGVGSKAFDAPERCDELYNQVVDFTVDAEAAMVVKLTGVPSGVTRAFEALKAADSKVNILAHAGNGVVYGKFAEYPGNLNALKAVAAANHGSATIVSNPSGAEMTHHNAWGCADVPFDVMKRVKEAFDPNNVLNPGRFVV